MALSTAAEPVPFSVDAHGVARVGGTRVTLDVIVGLYRMGESAEDLHRDFPTVDLADIYQLIAYSIRHKEEVDEYMRLAAERAAATRKLIESQPGYHEERAELKARLADRMRELRGQ
ncbi:MAG: DUF433 domain-containing protein [Dehalococcoidia bacterium]